ncbi:MAG: succinate dehydrogenase assembly factor 2 [Gammaproteobacteria bacterium SHHR-1]
MPSEAGLGARDSGLGLGGSELEDSELARLRWQCRRGLLELDLLFESFLERGYAQLDAAQRDQFQRLLQQPDPDLQAWLLAQQAPSAEFAPMVALIRAVALAE